VAANFRQGQALGWLVPGPSSAVTIQLNAAANWFALSLVPDQARTLSAVRAFVSAFAGTVNAGNITCDLYDSAGTGGVPGSAIESGKTTGAIAAAGWYDWTGFTTALTANQQYWLVWKNVNGTPASNNVTFRWLTGNVASFLGGSSNNRQAWGQATSTTSGVSWSNNPGRYAGRIAYADGSYDGIPTSNVTSAGSGDGVYAARESGMKFTSPANGVLKVAGLAMLVAAKTGSPTGSPRLGLWTGTTPSLVAYTNSLPATAISGVQWVYSYFASTQTLQPGTVCRVTLGETAQSDAVGNRWNNQEITWDSDANSLALLPFGGTCRKTYFDGSSTWTDTAGSLFGFALLPDTAGEFGSGGGTGGSSPLRSRLVGRGGA
jgi:hypothetical protein